MCKVLQVSVSGFYYWLNPVSLREQKAQALLACIKEVYHKSHCRYGSPRIAVELREQGIMASRPRGARLAVFEYMEIWYNRERRHSALNYKTPCQQEELMLKKLVMAG